MADYIISTIIPFFGAISILFGLYKGYQEYKKHNMLTRIEIYLRMRDKYARQEEVQKVCAALGNEDIPVSELTYEEKRLFLGTMETVALMVNSNVISKYVALYMFGYFAIMAWDDKDFWKGLREKEKDEALWSLYKDFVFQMKELQKKFEDETKNKVIIKNNLNFLPHAFKEYV